MVILLSLRGVNLLAGSVLQLPSLRLITTTISSPHFLGFSVGYCVLVDSRPTLLLLLLVVLRVYSSVLVLPSSSRVCPVAFLLPPWSLPSSCFTIVPAFIPSVAEDPSPPLVSRS